MKKYNVDVIVHYLNDSWREFIFPGLDETDVEAVLLCALERSGCQVKLEGSVEIINFANPNITNVSITTGEAK